MNAPEPRLPGPSNLDPTLPGRTPGLPVSAFCDPAWFARDMELLFKPALGYVGHRLMTPEPGDYQTLPWTDDGKALVHGDDGIALLGNTCRHRQARLLAGRGKLDHIVCPVHSWTYDRGGALLGAPEFDPAPPNCSLPRTPLREWQGLLFAGARDVAAELADFPHAADFDFSGYVFDRMEVEELPFNWKEFLEIYQELYHVNVVHPGLREWVDTAAYRWAFGADWSIQVVGVKEELRRQRSPLYARYAEAILAYDKGKVPPYGSLWATLYPNVMLEWYPGALVVSTLIPRGPDVTTNVIEFYYPEEMRAFEPQIVQAHQAAYMESAAEDAQAATRLHEGRRALWRAGEDDRGPYHPWHEQGVVHLYDWIWQRMGRCAT